MVWPWMLAKSYALVPRPVSRFSHGCFCLKKPGLLNGLYIYICVLDILSPTTQSGFQGFYACFEDRPPLFLPEPFYFAGSMLSAPEYCVVCAYT